MREQISISAPIAMETDSTMPMSRAFENDITTTASDVSALATEDDDIELKAAMIVPYKWTVAICDYASNISGWLHDMY